LLSKDFCTDFHKFFELATDKPVVARIVEQVSEITPLHSEINQQVVRNAVANFDMVEKNVLLVKALEQKYGWTWKLALETNRFVWNHIF